MAAGYVEALAAALAVNVVLGYAAFLPLSIGQVNLGIAGFMAVGAYSAAYLSNSFGIDPLGANILGALCAGALGAVTSLAVLRTAGIYLALATFAVNEIVRAIFLNTAELGGAAGYPASIHSPTLIPVFCALGIALIMAYLYSTRFALVTGIVNRDFVMADLFGVGVAKVRFFVFTASAAIAGFAGGLYAHNFNFVEAQYFTVMVSITTILYVVIGGRSSTLGPLIGATLFTLVPELLRVSAEWRFVLFAAVLIALVAKWPEGIAGAWKSRRFERREGTERGNESRGA